MLAVGAMSETAPESGPARPASAGPSGGMLSTITTPGSTLAPWQPQAPAPTFAGDDAAGGGIDPKRFWHAARRAWLPATLVGIALAGAAAPAAWFLSPKNFEAVGWLRIRNRPPSLAVSGPGEETSSTSYRQTQVQLLTSNYVIQAALRQPGVADLPLLKEQENKLDWLSRNLRVVMPTESEVVQVKLRGRYPQDLAQIVNAVVNSYLRDVVNKERVERLERRDQLEKKYRENMAEVRTRLDTYHNLAKSLGAADVAEVAVQRELLAEHLSSLRSQIGTYQRDLALIDGEIALASARERGEGGPDPDAVTAAVARDPQVGELQARIATLDEQLATQQGRSARGGNDPAVRRLVDQRAVLARRLAEREEALRPQVEETLAAEQTGRERWPGGRGAADGPEALRMRRKVLGDQLEQVSLEFENVAKQVKELGQANADLEARRREIAQLQTVTDQMGVQLRGTEIDINMPNRVELIEEAAVPAPIGGFSRLLLAGLSGALAFGLGALGTVSAEYVRDRLGAMDDLSRRIGLRLLGTVPRLKRARRKPNDGEIAECVDGVRTLVMQSGRERPRVILVTSAAGHEGKTTFASQFAASLARGGLRTLLLDGDLRHPNVHLALQLDLRSGFPELLRGEATPDEVVQPTGVDGLFAVTGGSCDYATVTALSRPDAGRIVRGFRDSFECVVIDAGPVLGFSDTLLLGQASDAAILVAMQDVSRVPLMIQAVEKLRSIDVRLIGAVVNGPVPASPRRYCATPTAA